MASFSEDVQAGTISFVLDRSSNNIVPSTVTYDVASRTVILDPVASLASGRLHCGSEWAEDLSGNTMTTASWSFTTAAAVSTVPTSRPNSGGGPDRSISSRRTKPLCSASRSGQHDRIQLTGPSNTLIPATVSYNAAAQTVFLQPSIDLAYSTTYTATLSATQDLYGNAMSSESWSFSTIRARHDSAHRQSRKIPAPGRRVLRSAAT